MGTLPQLIEEDMQRIGALLRELITKSDATTALLMDKGGFLIASEGDTRQFDAVTICALASGAYLANQTIANLIQEPNFNSVYQQGDNFSMFVVCVDEHCLICVIFKTNVSVGLVKYYAAPAALEIAKQLEIAQKRDPEGGLDLSVLNMADTSSLFKRNT